MLYRVTEKFYEDPDNIIEYDTLDFAKKHVDEFYKNITDTYDSCSIVQVFHEEDVDYKSPWENNDYRILMKMDKEELVSKLMGKMVL